MFSEKSWDNYLVGITTFDVAEYDDFVLHRYIFPLLFSSCKDSDFYPFYQEKAVYNYIFVILFNYIII